MNVFNFIKNKVQILDVINQHVTLRKAGHYWKGPCPFHSEKTASFTVSPHREIFYCFGCQETGDVISFVSKIENCSQIEAAKLLAEQYGVDVPEAISTEISTTNFDEKKKYFALCAAFASWCHDALLSNPVALDYVIKRGISRDLINLFKIGYFPSGQVALKYLIQALHKEHFILKDLIEAGIIVEGKMMYSAFEERIMFPIKDHLGRYCGFGGRVFKTNDERSKYYNSSENSHFQKGSLVFGLDLAKKEIQAHGTVFLVEGYTDCIAMHQYGYKNTIATLGTACTVEHLKLLSHYAHTVFIVYDGDNAGRKAMLRLTELCWQVNLELKIIVLPSGFDPASFLIAGHDLVPLCNDAQEIFDFFLDDVGKDFLKAPLQQKLSVARNFLEVIKKLPDQLKQDILLQKAAAAFELPLSSLRQEMRYNSNHFSHTIQDVKPIVKEMSIDEVSTLEKKFMYAILSDTHLLQKDSVIRLINYVPKPANELMKKLVEKASLGESDTYALFFDSLEEDEKRMVNKIMIVGGEVEEHFEQIELLLEKKYWKVIVHDTKVEIEQAQSVGDNETVQKIIGSFLDLKKKLLHKGLI